MICMNESEVFYESNFLFEKFNFQRNFRNLKFLQLKGLNNVTLNSIPFFTL